MKRSSSRIRSKKARKQRKELYNLPAHRRRKQISAHLCEELLLKYNVRAIPVRKGDTVKILRGGTGIKGVENKVATIDTKHMKITVEGVTIAKSDKKQVALSLDPSNVLLTKLDLSDPLRREKLDSLARTGAEE